MDAIIDSYLQVNILLTRKEARTLKKTGRLEGELLRTDGKIFPLKINTSKQGWRTETSRNRMKSYMIYTPPDAAEKILKGKVIGSEFPTISLRKIYMSLDTTLSF